MKKSNPHARDDSSMDSEEFEVSRLVDICYGDPANVGKRGLKFKVHYQFLLFYYLVSAIVVAFPVLL